MPGVTIYHEDGSTESIPTTTSWRVEREISKMYRLEITVERSLARAVSLTRKRDEVELDGYARGVLTDVESGDATVTLTVYSPEWYANQAAPTLGGLEVQGTDRELIRGRINTVSEWSEGTLAELTGPMTYVFSHAFNHNALRTIEANVPGELAFAGDGTVDYVDQRGTDRSGSFTLSPAAGNVEGRIRITERGTRLDATHLRVIGAHEGEAQRFANLVPADDGATYENRVDYSTPRWEPGDPRDWDTWANKDVMSQDTIEEEAAALGDELTETYVEVEATVSGDALNLGDFIRVVKPEADLDRIMRVHRVVTRSVDGTPAGTVQDVTLSTRTVAREDAAADKRDIQRFNKSFQGSSVAINVGPFRSAVDSGFPISIPFRYPDLEFENTATLQIRGLQYRTDSRPLEHSHDVTIDIPNHDHDVTIDIPDHNHGVTVNIPDHTHDVTIPVPAHTHDVSNQGVQVGLGRTEESAPDDPHDHIFEVLSDVGDVTEETQTSDSGGSELLSETTDNGGGFFDTETTDNGGAFFTTESSDTAAGSEEGIFTTGDTPSGVDVTVNGSTLATDIGTGTFETTVDVSGSFQTDAWNSIELSSDTLGLLQATLFIEGYDQVGTR